MVFYVGKGTKRPNRKTFTSVYYRAHSTQGRNILWQRVVNKHDYRIEIHSEYENEQDAFNKEMELIEFYGRRDLNKGYLVNVTNGGEGESGRKMSDEQKQKLSESRKGKPSNISEEGRKRLSELSKGENNYFYGKSFKGEANPFYGKKHTEETKDKMRGENNPMYGKKHSNETLNKIREKALTPEILRKRQIEYSNKVKVVFPNGKEITFECVTDCAFYFNCTNKNILFRNKQTKQAKFGIFKGIILKILK